MTEQIAAHISIRSANGRYVWKINTICRRPHISGGKKDEILERDFGKLSKYHPKFEVAQHTSFSCWFYSSQRFSAILRPHILQHRAHTNTNTDAQPSGLVYTSKETKLFQTRLYRRWEETFVSQRVESSSEMNLHVNRNGMIAKFKVCDLVWAASFHLRCEPTLTAGLQTRHTCVFTFIVVFVVISIM